MVALRSLFLAGLVVAVNSKREMKNEDENQVGFTPVSKITFLQSVRVTIASMEAVVEKEASDSEKSFTFGNWNLGTDDKKFISAEKKFAMRVAAEINRTPEFEEQLKSFDVESRLSDVKRLRDDTVRKLNSLSVEDFQGPFWAAVNPEYVKVETEKDALVASVQVTEGRVGKDEAEKDEKFRQDKVRIKTLEQQLKGMENGSSLSYEIQRYKTVYYAAPTAVGIWDAVAVLKKSLVQGENVVSAKSKFLLAAKVAEQKPVDDGALDEIIAARKAELAKIYLAGDTIPQWLKVVCGFAVGVVFGAFVYDVYTRKSDTVRAAGEGLV